MRLGTGNMNGVLRWIAGALTLGTVLGVGYVAGQRSASAESAMAAVEQLRQDLNGRLGRELEMLRSLEALRVELREINRRLTRIEERQ